MRSRKEIVGDCDALAEKCEAEILKLVDGVEGGNVTEGSGQRRTILSVMSVLGKVQTASLEVQLDIRDAVATWIAGDLSARSTAQQYRNKATDAVVKLLQGIDKKLDVLVQRGKP